MPIDKSKVTKDMIERAKQCKTAEELVALAKSEGIDITKEEADAYLIELGIFSLVATRLQTNG